MSIAQVTGIFIILVMAFFPGCRKNIVRDIDGNAYRSVKIGNQQWMTENLKTTRLNDGTPIPHITHYDEWAVLQSPAYSWYNNDSTGKNDYGVLYNWHTVSTGKLCPAGWHIPTQKEWFNLSMFLKVPELAGGILKETGFTHWKAPNTGATNESGFSARGSGYRSMDGSYNFITIGGFWWSSSEYMKNAWYGTLYYKTSAFNILQGGKGNGFSVRCIKDPVH